MCQKVAGGIIGSQAGHRQAAFGQTPFRMVRNCFMAGERTLFFL